VRRFLERWKPAAGARVHLILAATLWTCVGTGLIIAGIRWCLSAPSPWPAVLLFGGLAAGLIKGRTVLDRTATRSAARIVRRGDGKCLGGFLSWKTWFFVLAMMGMGAALRKSHLPRALLGLVYTAVGTGLLWGSRVFWAHWRDAA
jgi:hypothetical protein